MGLVLRGDLGERLEDLRRVIDALSKHVIIVTSRVLHVSPVACGTAMRRTRPPTSAIFSSTTHSLPKHHSMYLPYALPV